MPTSSIAVSQGSGKNLATNSLSEDAVTKELQRVVINNSSGSELGAPLSPVSVCEGYCPPPSTGGYYSVTGKSGTAAIAASLANDTTLMAMRFSAGSTRKAYIKKIRIFYNVITVGTSGLVPGILGIQRITTAVPTGGTSRTIVELDLTSQASDMAGVNDSNAALTAGSTVFTDEMSWWSCPIVITGANSAFEFIYEPYSPFVLNAGDGLALRTRQVFPGTQTWYFSYAIYWDEK
jgi:hypothetical protein